MSVLIFRSDLPLVLVQYWHEIGVEGVSPLSTPMNATGMS